MNQEQRNEIRSLILFYELHGWDWSSAVYFLVWKYYGRG